MRRLVTFLAYVAGFVACVAGGCASKAKPDAAVVVDAGTDAEDVAGEVAQDGGAWDADSGDTAD